MRLSSADLRLHGPLDKRLWKRLTRRRRIVLPAATVFATLVVMETDRGLSGVWHDPQDRSYRLRLTETFGEVKAKRVGNNEEVFEARFTEPRTLDGVIQLNWAEGARVRCGVESVGQDLKVEVAQDHRNFVMTYRAGTVPGNSCDAKLAPIRQRQMVRVE